MIAGRGREIVDGVKYSDAGGYMLLVAGALAALLIVAGRTGRSALRGIWARVGILRWVVVLIIVVIVVGITRQYPN